MADFLNIAAVCNSTHELGPGQRFALWVQGCPFRCKGCIAPDWIPMHAAQRVAVEDLARQILESGASGVSISGGEPFLQASKLTRLVELLWQHKPELTILVFTGFTLQQLDWIEALTFLKYIDVLKTGLYVEKWNDNQGLRGSSNQAFHFLTDRLKAFESELNHQPRKVEIQVEQNSFLMVGIPSKDFKF